MSDLTWEQDGDCYRATAAKGTVLTVYLHNHGYRVRKTVTEPTFAEKLDDAQYAAETLAEEAEKELYADTRWSVDDLTERYRCTEKQAREWLEEHECDLAEACCEAG